MTAGLFRAGALLGTRRAATNPRSTVDELELLLDGLLALDGLTMGDVDAVSLASVVPSLTAAIQAVADRRGQALVVAGAGTVPVAIRVERPDEVGADRLVNVLAAARLYGTPAVVMDLGTATTLECVAADGAYVGGAIAPGLELGMEALAARTAKLPRIELRTPDRAIGRTRSSRCSRAPCSATRPSRPASSSGSATSWPRRPGSRRRASPAILTGGLSAAPWARALRGIDAIDPDLTLKGLAILHAEVRGGEPLELGLS